MLWSSPGSVWPVELLVSNILADFSVQSVIQPTYLLSWLLALKTTRRRFVTAARGSVCPATGNIKEGGGLRMGTCIVSD
jgi:hypothetical protein